MSQSKSYFDLSPVPSTITSELTARSGKAGLEWTAKRFPWVHIRSFSSGCGTFNPLTSLSNSSLYDSNFLPKPVITSVKVKKLGELGTTRKATIELLAFSDDQLVELQKCFLVPGITVRVQFGWTLSATGQAPPSVYEGNTKSHPRDICEMNDLARQHTTYEGLQGLISNFTFSLNPNNQWEITFDVVSATDGVMNTKVDNCCCNCIETVNVGGNPTDEGVPQLLSFFLNVGEDINRIQYFLEALKAGGTAVRLKYQGSYRMPDGSEPTFFSAGFWKAVGNAVSLGSTLMENEESYISFAILEAAINAYSFPQTTTGPAIQLKSGVSALRSHPALKRIGGNFYTADPRVCSLKDAFDGDSIVLGKILVNTIFLASCFRQVMDGDRTLQTFITTVLDGINAACGNLWEFDVTNDAKCGDSVENISTIMIIDSSVAQDEVVSPAVIPAIPGNSAVRAIQLDLKLTEAMKTQVLYGNKQSSQAKNCSNGVNCEGVSLGIFGLDSTIKDESRDQIKPHDKKDCSCNTVPKPAGKKEKTFAEIFEELTDKVTDKTVNSAVTELKKQYTTDNEPQTQKLSCKQSAVPFSFGFTVDGIGGFKFGQAVTTNRIPSSLTDKAIFQITSVEHELTAQDWTTTVSTIARWKV